MGYSASSILWVLILVSFAFCIYQTASQPDKAFYLLPSRFWELGLGALLYQIHHNEVSDDTNSNGSWSNIIFIFGGLAILSGLILSNPKKFPFPWALLPVIGTMLLIHSLVILKPHFLLKSLLENRGIVYIGKISYSLYLWHWPVFVLFRWTSGLGGNEIYAIVLVVLLSIFSYHFIEVPFRKKIKTSSNNSLGVVKKGALAIVISAVFLGVGVFNQQQYLSLSVTKDKSTWYPDAWSDSKLSGEGKNIRQIFVLGDSHAGAYSSLFKNLTKDRSDIAVKIFSKGGCGVADLRKPSAAYCNAFIESALKQIKSHAREGDVVFLASLKMERLSDQWKTFDDDELKERRLSKNPEAALIDADKLISELHTLSLQVIIDAPKPVFKSPPFRCADWFNAMNPVCHAGFTVKRQDLLESRLETMKSLDRLKQHYPDLIVWDTFFILCPESQCSAFKDGKPLYFDGDHISAYGNQILYPSFFKLISSLKYF